MGFITPEKKLFVIVIVGKKMIRNTLLYILPEDSTEMPIVNPF